MAEIKTGVFAKNVQKRLNRAQEKVLQKLGKADETKDEQFEQVVVNFRRQESEGSRLQREMKAYMSAIKAMQQVSINLTQSLHEVYEPDWHGKDDVMVIGKDCDAMWEDFHNKLVDSLLLNLDEYLLQFPDLKTRVAKRSRKLIDYDSARHHMETLQMSGMKNDRKMMKVSPCVVKRGEVGDQVLYQLDGVHGLKPTCCFLKAEEELKKAQKVFDELDVGLQDELPTLWDSRVGFYISTYKSVTNLEAKFHREISLVCRQLYEVMTQLAEQHSDKMFTIQGAPSDSGPLRLARTPSPPEDESSPESPEATSNHMLHPASPGPPRPKSPIQLKKGPPMPPPPKATPTKEVAEEQIIDLFGGDFLPAPSPSQPNERPGESLLDLDFDAFQPQESVSPIPQTAVPWDMWSQAADTSFVADWSADFGSLSAKEDAAPGVEAPAVGLERAQGGAQGGAQDLPQTDGWQPGADTTTPPQDSEVATAAEDEVSSWNYQTNPNLHSSAVRADEVETRQSDSVGATGQEDRRKSTPGLIFTNEYGEEIEDSTEDRGDEWSGSPDRFGSEYETAEELGDAGQGGGWASADDELSYEDCPPVNVSEGLGCGHGGGAGLGSQTVEQAYPESEAAEEELTGKEYDLKSVYSDPFAETRGGGAFDSDPFAETRGGGAFDSDPFAETRGGGAFDSDPFAETRGGGAFDSDPFAETRGGGAFDSDPFAETRGGGAFDSDPFAETRGGGAFDSDPFAETRGGGAFDSDPFAETRGGGAFDSDPFAETRGGGAFDSDPFAETRGGGAFDSDPVARTEFGNKGVGFELDQFAATSGEGGLVSTGDGERGGWDTDSFANTFPAASSGTEGPSYSMSWQNVSHNSDFDSFFTQQNFASAAVSGMAKGIQDVIVTRIHKEPEHSDMSEDESANRRFGKLSRELDTEKEEENNALHGFLQDSTAPSFFADFNKMKEVPADLTDASEVSVTEVAAEKENPSSPPAVEEPPGGGAGSEVEDFAASSGGEEDAAESSGSLKEDKFDVSIPPADEDKASSAEAAPSEKMPIPSVVIEPASSNEGDDDRDADIISPTAISDNGVAAESQTIKHMSPSGGVSGLPDDFLYKVETMHDFEAANSDELELNRGDVVLVVPTASVEDQEAGWLTGFKESEWLTLGAGAHKGLFPDNFTQRLE
ncbi:amphiphysin isoform X4 [Pseudoliparis swirei]|uniref:amphiphysin isoform X4 n=1 Tax=Pseudoliparis swirei TaxID=2059687 RepID=UPI0024BE5749|nr:amphiphysin isoform X4 [Pseudoliparis swirei]